MALLESFIKLPAKKKQKAVWRGNLRTPARVSPLVQHFPQGTLPPTWHCPLRGSEEVFVAMRDEKSLSSSQQWTVGKHLQERSLSGFRINCGAWTVFISFSAFLQDARTGL